MINKMLFKLLFLFFLATKVSCDESFLMKFKNETVLSLKLYMNFNDADEFCRKFIGGNFPSIHNEDENNELDSIGLKDIFLDVNKENNYLKRRLFNQRTYTWQENGSFLNFSLRQEGSPNCLGACCTVVYNNGKFSDHECDSLKRMVCVLPQVEDPLLNSKKKELIKNILDSSDENEALKVLLLNYYYENGIDSHIKNWKGKNFFYDSRLAVNFDSWSKVCKILGAFAQYNRSNEEKLSLNHEIKFIGNRKNFHGMYHNNEIVYNDTRCNSPCCVIRKFNNENISGNFFERFNCSTITEFICDLPEKYSLAIEITKMKQDKIHKKLMVEDVIINEKIKRLNNATKMINTNAEKIDKLNIEFEKFVFDQGIQQLAKLNTENNYEGLKIIEVVIISMVILTTILQFILYFALRRQVMSQKNRN